MANNKVVTFGPKLRYKPCSKAPITPG